MRGQGLKAKSACVGAARIDVAKELVKEPQRRCARIVERLKELSHLHSQVAAYVQINVAAAVAEGRRHEVAMAAVKVAAMAAEAA